MKKLVVAIAVLLSFGAKGQAARYVIDAAHSEVGFKVKHMMVGKTPGKFDRFAGEFMYDEKNPAASSVQATIETASINTGNNDRDNHLRAPDFFDATKYPTITFKSNGGITDLKDNKGKINGMLNMHGVEKPVVLDIEVGGVVKDMMGMMRAGFEAKTKINRKDFGIVWNKALDNGGVAIGEEVEIEIHIEGVLPKTEEPMKKPAVKQEKK